jgi:TRAP transporter 4TM/12TM fusion protein
MPTTTESGWTMTATTHVAARLVALGMAVFQLYTAFTIVLSPMLQRSIHLGLALTLLYLITPAGRRTGRADLVVRWLAAADSAAATAYAAVEFVDPEVLRVVDPTRLDLAMGTLLVLLVLEATRRAAGLSLALVTLAFFVYAFVGPWLPGLLGHPGFSYSMVISSMYIRLEGIFGLAIGASATYIYIFVLFGAFMMRMGGGDFFIRLAQAAIGSVRGAAAKVAVLASAFFATITGTGAANVAAVGVVTIPTMVRSGFTPRIAAAVEAAASVGGQITPPVMGASAFIMADLLGVPYHEIARAALFPAVLYFTSIFITVDLEAARQGLRGTRREELPPFWATLRDGWHFVAPVGVLVYLLAVLQISPTRAGAWAVATFAPLWCVRELLSRRWPDLRAFGQALEESSHSAVMIAAACAAVGIVMNVTDLTGLGLKFTSLILGYSGGSLMLLLILTMLASILLGTGLPTTATYLIVAILAAPALAKIGIPLLAAHLFVFYFGVISDLTPPTAVSCFVAGGIAGEPGLRVAFTATRVALPGFIVPFMFIYSPALLLQGSPLEIVLAGGAALLGMAALSVATVGYWRVPLQALERVATGVGGLLLIVPGIATDAVGVSLLAVVVVTTVLRRVRQPALAAPVTRSQPRL